MRLLSWPAAPVGAGPRWSALFALGLLAGPALAAGPKPGCDGDAEDFMAARPARPDFLSVYLDNDLFAGEDRDYTNGARLALVSANEKLVSLAPFREALHRISCWAADDDEVSSWSGFGEDNVADKRLQLDYGLSLTQLMFTPQDPDSATQPPGQRRYAGWLALGFSVHAADEHAMNSAELLFGTVGPRALAEQTQDFIHDIRGIPEFQGWDDQVPNEFTLDLLVVQKRRLQLQEPNAEGFSVDGYLEGAARLGTFQTGTRAGGFFRAGFNLGPDYSDPRLGAASYSYQLFQPSPSRSTPAAEWSLYGLGGANLGLVLFDATLDGPLFKDFDTGNTREPWIAESYLGFGLRWKQLDFSYVHTWRTEAYGEQDGSTEFGSLALSLKFDLAASGQHD